MQWAAVHRTAAASSEASAPALVSKLGHMAVGRGSTARKRWDNCCTRYTDGTVRRSYVTFRCYKGSIPAVGRSTVAEDTRGARTAACSTWEIVHLIRD